MLSFLVAVVIIGVVFMLWVELADKLIKIKVLLAWNSVGKKALAFI